MKANNFYFTKYVSLLFSLKYNVYADGLMKSGASFSASLYTVADPGFPREEGANPKEGRQPIICQLFSENYIKIHNTHNVNLKRIEVTLVRQDIFTLYNQIQPQHTLGELFVKACFIFTHISTLSRKIYLHVARLDLVM